MTASPAVSVVIPAYGHADLVEETLRSVFAQTFTDYETVVVNDGSPDRTAEVLRPYAEAGRVRYVEQANGGQAAARNRGVREARGRYLALLDDDDLWPDDKLAWQVAALDADPALLAVGGTVEKFDPDGRVVDAWGGPSRTLTRAELLSEGNAFTSPGQVLFRRRALEAVGGFDPAIWGADDYDLLLRLVARGPVAVVDRPALRYRVHGANASRHTVRHFESVVRVLRKHLREGTDAERRAAYRWAYAFRGRRIIGLAKEGVRAGEYGRAAHTLAALRHLLGPALRDARLQREIVRDLLPARISQAGRAD